jgi:hypothetical protein
MFLTFYFTIALLNDFLGSNELSQKNLPFLRKVRDYVFTVFTFPVCMNVAGTFWVLYAIDRELVLPKAMDYYFFEWYNHLTHTNIVFFILIEMIFSYHKYPCNKSMIAGLGSFLVGYTIWLHVVNYVTGILKV